MTPSVKSAMAVMKPDGGGFVNGAAGQGGEPLAGLRLAAAVDPHLVRAAAPADALEVLGPGPVAPASSQP